MKKLFKRVFAGTLAVAITAASIQLTAMATGSDNRSFADVIQDGYANPEMEYKPEIRWWVAEGSQCDSTLKTAIKDLHDAGFGGIEFVTLDEASLDPDIYGWGSDAWIYDTQLIVEECTKYDMGVSFTSGTHWGTANLTSINADDPAALQAIGYKTIDLQPGETFQGKIPVVSLPNGATKMSLVGVVATQIISENEEITALAEQSMKDITNTVITDENTDVYGDKWGLNYTAPAGGTTRIFCFYQYGSAHENNPAKGTAYTINYFSEDGANAFVNYWENNVVTEDLEKVIRENGDVQLFMDSLEYSINGDDKVSIPWTSEFLDEFKARQGYDLTPYLPLVIAIANNQARTYIDYFYELDGNQLKTQKIINDVYQVLTELYTEKCLTPIADWLHTKGMTLRAQNSYGQILESNEPIPALDYVETESLCFSSEIESYRMQAGGAHLFDKTFSSETGAVKYGLYNRSYDFYMQTFYTQFASGVQRTVLHGYSTDSGTVGNTKWPGFEGMSDLFSSRFNNRQPAWQDYNDTNLYLSRLQKALRQGTAKMDLAILRTDYFQDHRMMYQNGDAADGERSSLVNGKGKYWTDTTLQNHGYTYDYMNPMLLCNDQVSCTNGQIQEDGVGYQAVLLYQEFLPLEAAKQLYQWASEQDLPIVLVTGATTEMERIQYEVTHQGAALHTTYNDGNDEALQQVMAQLKQLPNVKAVSTEAEAYDALQQLNVHPRVEYAKANQNLLTAYRHAEQDNHDSILTDLTAVAQADYVYVYNYQDGNVNPAQSYTGQIMVDGIFTPYLMDCWTNEITELGDYYYQDGKTVINVSLEGGEVAMYVLNPVEGNYVTGNNTQVIQQDGKFSFVTPQSGTYKATLPDGTEISKQINVPEEMQLNEWNLTVESFTKGEKHTKTEVGGDGMERSEDYYTTNKNKIDAGKVDLVPWKDIPAIGGEVSGVGHYTTTITLAQAPAADETILLNLDSFCGGTAAVFVNGQKAEAVNLQNPKVDITDLLIVGENTIEIRVSTTLANACAALAKHADESSEDYGRFNWITDVADYGLVGEASLVTYKTVPVDSAENENQNQSGNQTNPGSSSPQTGDTAPAGIVVLLGITVTAAVISRKRKS